MANTINPYSGNSATSVATNRSSQTAASASATGTSATNSAPPAEVSQKVRISDTAAKLASIGSTLSAQPAIDPAKVAQISKALANGTYTISADKIASGLMQSEQTLAQIGIE
jgi:negative regulator of flagellin synthesis FlgM